MTDVDPRRICTVLLLTFAISLLAGSAAARSERKLPYDREEVFRCFIRLLRVDLDLKVHEKDLDGGFVLFEYREPIYKRLSPASLEIIEISPGDKAPEKDKAAFEMKVKLFMEIKRAGASDEISLLDKLQTKLRQDYGRR